MGEDTFHYSSYGVQKSSIIVVLPTSEIVYFSLFFRRNDHLSMYQFQKVEYKNKWKS